MTVEEALEEAVRRWGPEARVFCEESTCVTLCLVGVERAGEKEPEWLGVGRTWALAFEEADHAGR